MIQESTPTCSVVIDRRLWLSNGSRLSCGASADGRKHPALRYEPVGAQTYASSEGRPRQLQALVRRRGSLTALELGSHTARPLSTLPKGRRYRGGVVIHNQPAPVGLHIHETVACRDCLRLAVLDIGEGVVPSVDGRLAVDTDELLAEAHPVFGKDFERGHEVLTQRCWPLAHRRRQGTPEHSVGRVEVEDLVGIVVNKPGRPLGGGGGDFLLGAGPDGSRNSQQHQE